MQGCEQALADRIEEALYVLVGMAIAFAVFEVRTQHVYGKTFEGENFCK